jgi:hypothetical protein
LRVQINLILIQKREKCPLLDLMKIQWSRLIQREIVLPR